MTSFYLIMLMRNLLILVLPKKLIDLKIAIYLKKSFSTLFSDLSSRNLLP